MASQHFFAFSDRIVGLGQLESCSAFGTLAAAQAAAKAGDIASLSHFKASKVYAMQGGFLKCPKSGGCSCAVAGDTCDTCGCCCAAAAGKFYQSLGADV